MLLTLIYIHLAVVSLVTWPTQALVLIGPLQTRGSVLAGVRSTFRNILFTVVAYKACPLTVTDITVHTIYAFSCI